VAVQVAGQQPGPFQRDQPGSGQPDRFRGQGLDPRPLVDRDRGQRQILGQAQRQVGAQPVLEAEPLGPAQQDAP